ncbi:hypothetical protein L218DRAFT_1009795 [Marasmius fiardii PR-910]|nr:hypothetical protein L218DRAFT_1009795 [Marasmius fiardii PR-910]
MIPGFPHMGTERIGHGSQLVKGLPTVLGVNPLRNRIPPASRVPRKGGPKLRKLGDSNTLVARAVRWITNHAPVGEYYRRFNIPNTSRLCTCWSAENSQSAVVQTRTHVLHHCPDVKHSKNIDYVVGLAQFLKKNPQVFSFGDPAPRAGVG